MWMWDRWDFGVPATARLNGSATTPEVFGHRTSLNFVDAIWEIFGALMHGAVVDIAPREAQRDMAAQARWITRQGVTHALAFPSALSLLLEQWEEAPPMQLHTLISTGEALSTNALRNFNSAMPQCRLINTYGTSENWDIAAVALQARQEEAAVPVGMPVANMRVHILDRHNAPLPAGVAGRLCVAGYGVDNTYINGAAETADFYFSDPDDPSGKLFYTGDLGSMRRNGELLLHGRADRQLKLRGVRIEPGEIEALVNACAGVRQSAVVLQGADSTSAWLALYVVIDDGQDAPTVSAGALRGVLTERLPASAIPADIVFVDAIPLTPSGKVDALSLAQSMPTASPGVSVPVTATEAALIQIWKPLLNIDHLGAHDNFFAMRGNSLLATKVIARICDRFDIDLPLAGIFESPTVAELARIVDAMLWARQGSAARKSDDGEREVVRL
jgi:acyl-coenzyme A synthetase/AMP-(fatty) acid ligase